MVRVGGRRLAAGRNGIPALALSTTSESDETMAVCAASGMSTVWLTGGGDHVGKHESRLFFAFVGPVFRLVKEHLAGLAGWR